MIQWYLRARAGGRIRTLGSALLLGVLVIASLGGARALAQQAPAYTLHTALTPTDTALAGFGGSVALSADGSTALIEAFNAQKQANVVYALTRASGGVVSLAGATILSMAGDATFGQSLALSADGRTAIIGAPGTTPSNSSAPGAAYVYTRAAGSPFDPNQFTTLAVPGTRSFGQAVAISADNLTALVGAFSSGSGPNAAYLFTRTQGGSFSPSSYTTLAGPATAAGFGDAVALSGDGSTALVGSLGDFSTNTSIVYAYTRGASGFGAATPLQFSGGAGTVPALALSGDGLAALIGLPSYPGGAAYALARAAGGAFSTAGAVTLQVPGSGDFGSSVALSADGQSALVGAFGTNGNDGAVHAYSRAAGPNAFSTLYVPPSSFFGNAVALSGDGQTALIGAYQTSGHGAAYVFSAGPAGAGATTTGLAVTPNPAIAGQTLTLTATVAPVAPGSGTPTGTVTFYLYTQPLGTAALGADGRAVLTTSSKDFGCTNSLTARYSGDATFAASNSAPVSEAVNTVYTFTVPAGWSLISPWVGPNNPLSARTLVSTLLASGGGVYVSLSTLRNSVWAQGVYASKAGSGGIDFALEEGKGYLVFSDRASSYTFTGCRPSDQPTWHLSPGWNLVGIGGVTLSEAAGYVAAGLLTQTGGNPAAMAGLQGGQVNGPEVAYSTPFERGVYGIDFSPIQSGLGYLLFTDRAADFNPFTAQPYGGANPGLPPFGLPAITLPPLPSLPPWVTALIAASAHR